MVVSPDTQNLHSICDDCYLKKNGRGPYARVPMPDIEYCCYCGKIHSSGIYIADGSENCHYNGNHRDVPLHVKQEFAN